MNHLNQTDFPSWLTRQIETCSQRRTELLADNRKDEANFEKIRENIYDIFRTIHTVAGKNHADDPARRNLFFLNKLVEMQNIWLTALNQAELHGDDIRAHQERLKVDAAQQIKEAFLRLEGVVL